MPVHPAPPFDAWLGWQAWGDTWAAGLDPTGLGRRLRDRRLAALIEVALRDSPLYRKRSPNARGLADFAPIGKDELMRDFDEWATDRRITRAAIAPFVADPGRVAEAWLGDYLVWTSSGTSGQPGIFVQDRASLAAFDAIEALRLGGAGASRKDLGAWSIGRRFAYVGAIGGHYAGHVSVERLRRLLPPGLMPSLHLFSVLEPLSGVAASLQALRPGVLITYPSCAAALAQMQLEGALRIAPAEIWLGGEQYTEGQRRLLAQAFGCPVRNSYGASEFYAIAGECRAGVLHVNDDWVCLEPVDARLQPVAPGELSHTTLLTNLANRVQPLIRYRLGDRTRWLPGRCACGSAFPAIEVHGRADDTLVLPGRLGRPVRVLPLALETAIEEDAQLANFQVLRCGPATLELRIAPDALRASGGADAFRRGKEALAAYLARQGVVGVNVRRGRVPPQAAAGSGKLRRVVDLVRD